MSGTVCSICLDELKDPVSIPCGHIHCERCLVNYIENQQDALQATCPTCRTEFSLATPDLRVIPRKYHPYINTSLRRIYIPVDAAQGNVRIRIAQLEAMVENLRTDKTRLMERAESNIRKAHAVGERERQTREENAELRREVQVQKEKNQELRTKYNVVKEKYKQLKHTVRNPTPPPPAFPLPTPPHHASNAKLKRTSEQAFSNSSPTRPDDGLRVVRPIPKRPRLVQGAGSASMAIKLEEEDRGIDAHVKLEPREYERVPSAAARTAAPAAPVRRQLGDDLAYAVERLRGVLAQTRSRPSHFRGRNVPEPVVKKEEGTDDENNVLLDGEDDEDDEQSEDDHGVKQEDEEDEDAFYSFHTFHSSPIRPSAGNNTAAAFARARPREASQSPFRGPQRMMTRSQTRQKLEPTNVPSSLSRSLPVRRPGTPGPSAPGTSVADVHRRGGAHIKQEEAVPHLGWRTASASGRGADMFSPSAAQHGGQGNIDFSMSDGVAVPDEDEDEDMDTRSYAEMSGVEENGGEDSDARRERERREKGKERERVGERERMRKQRAYVFKGMRMSGDA